MRKILVLIALALAVFAPSSAAFAGGAPSDARGAEPWSALADAGTALPPGGRIIFYGCYGGQLWQATINANGVIFGRFIVGSECEGTFAEMMVL